MELFIIFFWLVLAFVVASYGSNRKIGFGLSLLASLIFSPLIGFICVALSDKNEKQTESRISNQQGEISSQEATKYNKIETRFKSGEIDIQTAINEVEIFIMANPKVSSPHIRLSRYYSILKNKDKCYFHLSRASELGYRDFGTLQANPDLEFIRAQPDYKQFCLNGYKF